MIPFQDKNEEIAQMLGERFGVDAEELDQEFEMLEAEVRMEKMGISKKVEEIAAIPAVVPTVAPVVSNKISSQAAANVISSRAAANVPIPTPGKAKQERPVAVVEPELVAA